MPIHEKKQLLYLKSHVQQRKEPKTTHCQNHTKRRKHLCECTVLPVRWNLRQRLQSLEKDGNRSQYVQHGRPEATEVRDVVVVDLEVGLAVAKKRPDVESRQADLAVVVAQRDLAVAHLGVGLDEAAPRRPVDGSGDELEFLREVKVGLVDDQLRVRPQEAASLGVKTVCSGSLVPAAAGEVQVPDLGAEEVLWYRLDKDPLVVPQEMEIASLCWDDPAALDALVVQGADIAAIGRQE